MKLSEGEMPLVSNKDRKSKIPIFLPTLDSIRATIIAMMLVARNLPQSFPIAMGVLRVL